MRDAIMIAFEGIPGAPAHWVLDEALREAVRDHVIAWVYAYAVQRGIILDAKRDIEPELDVLIQELYGIAIARKKVPT